MPYKAVIFDLDGTLVNSMDDIGSAMNRVLAGHGFPTHDLSRYAFFVGEGAHVLAEKALPEGAKTPENIAEMVEGFIIDYGENWKDLTKPYPHIPELLKQLGDMQVVTAVLSNKNHDVTQKCIHHFFPENDFKMVLGQRPDVPKKPDPAGAFEISRGVGIPSHEFVFVGDTGIDMGTGTAASMYPVGVLWGFRPESELRANGAQMLINDPMELIPLFETGHIGG